MDAHRYIDLTTDFGFKRIFGSEANKPFLKAFLNELFQGRLQIADLQYGRNEHVGDTVEMGTVIFDLLCSTEAGEHFLIEVQRSTHLNLKRRMLYYGSKLIADSAPRGQRRSWDYAISAVYVVVLLDGFPIPGGGSGADYLQEICLCNRRTGEVFYEEMAYLYVELVKFVKQGADLQSDLDRWLYVLKNMSKLDGLPVHLRQPIFEQLFEIAAYTQLNKEERHMYDVSLKRKWDAAVVRKYQEQEQAKTREALKAAEAALKAAEAAEEALVTGLKEAMDKGLIEGLEKGLEKGLEQGLEQGLEHGLEQGAHRKAIAIATTMKKSGISAEDIAIYTGLSLADIEALSTSK
ncbi:Rpn family recombination-promoting nuclease/putative transposase [Sphingobacterium griseoflavum]|uniref:Rpn family recombination-promoting nuclease/putative transposase n=2 Tax=Sphingobacterium griseoflavum TaxID=1474952 RepID=A0ABQ3HVH6_9SPHI|nr:Rpn family recombination-promoting nuclease/putative transposase [Sphingobacterium griseoflavum]GHE30211.1 hypothetical protein GCM10017764_11400 [Sphingobacterium griseoflavum]